MSPSHLGYKGLAAAAAAKSLQSCPTLCDPTDGSPLGSPVPGILQARTLEWVATSFSNAWKWRVKVESVSHVRFFATQWTAAYRLFRPWDFPGKSTGVGCHRRVGGNLIYWDRRYKKVKFRRWWLHICIHWIERYVIIYAVWDTLKATHVRLGREVSTKCSNLEVVFV